MVLGIVEPIIAGITISLINKYIINNNCLYNYIFKFRQLNSTSIERRESSDSSSSTTTVLSDIALNHIHSYH